MSLSHQKFREIVFQLLYSQDLGHPSQELMIELIMNELAVSKKNVKLALDRVQQIMLNLPQIDSMIAAVSTSYNFDRIQLVTKNILRLGVFELFFNSENPPIPPKVAIAEGIRLSRKFNSPESATFVNALLDHLYQASLGHVLNNESLEKEAEILLENEENAARKALEKENGESLEP